jgi:hypothetical protein
LVAQFNRIGLYARQLNTQEIIEIYYNNYNPEAYEGQQITNTQDYTTAVVNAGTNSAPSLDEIRAQLQTKAQLEELSGQETPNEQMTPVEETIASPIPQVAPPPLGHSGQQAQELSPSAPAPAAAQPTTAALSQVPTASIMTAKPTTTINPAPEPSLPPVAEL